MADVATEEELMDPNLVKVVVDCDGFALYFSRSPIPYPRAGTFHEFRYHHHIGLYVYRREFLLTFSKLPRTPLEKQERLEQLRVLEHGYRIRVVPTKYRSISVDTPEDLEKVRLIMAGQC